MTSCRTAPRTAPGAIGVSPIAVAQGCLLAGDLGVICLAVLAGTMVDPAPPNAPLSWGAPLILLSRRALGLVVALTWCLALTAAGTMSYRMLGYGAAEYRRVLKATSIGFSCLALLAYLGVINLPRPYITVSLPIGLTMLLLWRCAARRFLIAARRRGRLMSDAYVVGSHESASWLIDTMMRRPELGLRPCGAFLGDEPGASSAGDLPVPVIGEAAGLPGGLAGAEGVTLVIAPASGLGPREVRRIGWELGPSSRLIMVPSLLEVTGSRLALRPVAGMSLLEVRLDSLGVLKTTAKRLGDIVVSAILIVLLTPLWVTVPALILCEDRGPALFRQTRIGKDGRPFTIWKFRTMRINAEAELAALLSDQGSGSTPLFKVSDDPRITRIGRVLRRTSLDEFPQLFNVLHGSMSLVGPRPQVPKEVELYDERAARRLLVKPGMTGLWQVNGRSRLTWEEALRFDLFYVENWSLTMDMAILLKTIKVVLTQEGSE